MQADHLSDDETRRYMRQLVISPFNTKGQLALKSSRVLVIGAGGLGSPVIAYLAAAGVGEIVIADPDTVSISNLNRQIIYGVGDIGTSKAVAAADFAQRLNSNIRTVPLPERIEEGTVEPLVRRCDIVVDGSDTIETRRTVAEACLWTNKVLVAGAVGQLEGLVTVFPPQGVRRPVGFDQIFPTDASSSDASCSAIGTIGAVTGVIGSLMAMETIKLLAQLGQSVSGRVIRYDALSGRLVETALGGSRHRLLVGG